jgi:NMD protein affecting ribosome stability and mRNA decay
MMTPKEELIQAIEQLPDPMVRTLLNFLSDLQQQSGVQLVQTEQSTQEEVSSRLHRKQGVLVIETEELAGFDINAFIGEMREERIQHQIGQVDS